jgi:acyl-CoA synthetase (AMP-forming)/AMP-acid ligase II
MASPLTPEDRAAFYGAAVLGLRALDARERTPRRFGTDAEARWAQFAGSLAPGDRIDILLRDAVGTWGAAFSPSECFGIFGLADDEPFGPDWVGIDDRDAKRLLAAPGAPATLEHIASGLGVMDASIPVPPVNPSTKLAVAGGSAIVSVAKVFADNSALSWTDQIVVIATRPAWRQLAGLAAVLLGARGRTVLVRPGADKTLRVAGFAHLDAAVVSPDAEPEAAELARNAGGK